MITSNAAEILARYEDRIARLLPSSRQDANARAQECLKIAIRLSSGPYRTAWLRQQARMRKGGRGLYSKADPAPPADPSVINVQTGAFRAGWRVAVVASGSGYAINLSNVSPEAAYLLAPEGTHTMIPRPILAAIHRQERDAHPSG